jgi:hypothetical protein
MLLSGSVSYGDKQITGRIVIPSLWKQYPKIYMAESNEEKHTLKSTSFERPRYCYS